MNSKDEFPFVGFTIETESACGNDDFVLGLARDGASAKITFDGRQTTVDDLPLLSSSHGRFVGSVIRSVEETAAGALQIDLEDGRRIKIARAPQHEAWEIAGPGDFFAVAAPE